MLGLSCAIAPRLHCSIPRVPPCEVRDLVLLEAGGGGAVDQFLIHVAGEIFVHIEFAGLELLVERGVLLVDDFVAGEMFAAQAHGLVERRAPDLHRLPRDGEHEVEVDVLKAGGSQRVVGAEDHVAGMNAPETVEQSFVEGLHTHADAVHAVFEPEAGLVGGDRGGIAFDGPFLCAQQAEFLEGAEDVPPLLEAQDRGRAAAEEDRARPQVGGDQLQLAHERLDVALDEIAARRLRVECAVLALVRAERHMHVKAAD